MSQPQGGPASPPSFLNPPYQSIKWVKGGFFILDQRRLPTEETYLEISSITEACQAIRTLAVRGAPLIGVFAALALAHAARRGGDRKELLEGIRALSATRPTAVNLFGSLAKMEEVIRMEGEANEIVSRALGIWAQEKDRSYGMAANAQPLIKDGARLGTYCNTGALAAPGIGTALGGLIKAHLEGKRIQVVVPETRPLLQGSRLTAWELSRWGIPYTLVTESAVAGMMEGIDAFLVGADRIAATGEVANKVGTLGLAVLARHFAKGFYVVAPTTTIDLSLASGSGIPIEERSQDEVRRFSDCLTSPSDAPVHNPAFDLTPSDLVTAIITEKGIHTPPFKDSLPR